MILLLVPGLGFRGILCDGVEGSAPLRMKMLSG